MVFKADATVDVLERLNNKKIGSKHVAVRYAKALEPQDDKKTFGSLTKSLTSSASSSADKKSKIQLLEEQLKHLQNSTDDFEINSREDGSSSEPLIKKYQQNKDLPQNTYGSRHNYHNKRRRPY